MALRFTFDSAADAFARQAEAIYDPIAEASSSAIKKAADQIKTRGRADIASAGFGKKWQDTLRVNTYPKGQKASANAAALVYHKIKYADVFENGSTVRGSPMLWLPLKSTPKKLGRRRFRPEVFVEEIGPLVSITRNPSRPLLGAPMTVSRFASRRGGPLKVTLAALRRGAAGQRQQGKRAALLIRTVPLFHGVRQIQQRRRFNITEIIAAAVDDLPALYAAALKDE